MQLSLLPKQHEFFCDHKTRYLAYVGGYGSGKTKALAYKVINLASRNTNLEGALMSPTYGMLQRVMLPTLEDCLRELNIKYTYERTIGLLTIQWNKDHKTKIHLLAAENWRRAAGLNLAFACIDEIDLIDKDDADDAWKMFQSRLRKGKVFQMACVSTPEGYGFLHKYFVTEGYNADGTPKSDRRLIRVSSRDNPFLPREFLESLLQDYPSNLVESYIDGYFTNLTSGPVYYAFNRNDNAHSKTLANFQQPTLNVGVDFNIGRCAAIASVVENGVIYVVDEICDGYNTEDLMNKIMARWRNHKIMFYPDSAGNQRSSNSSQTDIQIMRRVPNSTVHFNNQNPRIRDRVGAVNAMICNGAKQRKLLVNPKTCPTLTASLEQQGYDEQGLPEKVNDLDHPLDALGYFVSYRYPIRGAAVLRQLF